MSVITLKQLGKSEIEITKSVFIGHAAPVTTPEEANSFVNDIRSRYPDARHNCYAWIVNGDVVMQKYSDDGEPQGTAGMPILSCITKQNITNAAIVVTRYFGGILLGKGGLVRAYSEAASEAVRNAGIVELKDVISYSFRCDYSLSERILYDLKTEGHRVDSIDYGADVGIEVTCLNERNDEFIKLITDTGTGKIELKKVREGQDFFD
ncbi:MAG: YigZ family protein [Clostridia bacterium]|nr:YigZ family protein [Clostridia bacterium]